MHIDLLFSIYYKYGTVTIMLGSIKENVLHKMIQGT